VTWGEIQQVAGNSDNPFHNPTAVVDQDTGTVWLAFGQEAFQTFVIHSNDSGATWSEPLEITRDVTAPEWVHHVVGPGSGIQTKSGRLILTGDHIDNTRYDSVFSRSHVIYSDDHGANWQLGGRLERGTNECEVVETTDGSLYMTSRSADRSKFHRISAWRAGTAAIPGPSRSTSTSCPIRSARRASGGTPTRTPTTGTAYSSRTPLVKPETT